VKIAIVCNSINPDLVQYFRVKVDRFFNDDRFIFLGNIRLAKHLKIKCSSFSKDAGFHTWILVDAIFSIFIAIRLCIKNVKCVVFDTAHASNIPLAILLKLLKVKLVFTIHDWEPHEGRQQRAVKLYNNFVDKYLADEYIVFSPVNSARPVNLLTLSGFEKKGEPNKCGNYFLFFGRIEPYKGLRNLLTIAKMVLNQGFDYKFVIAGKGDDVVLDQLASLSNVEIINRFITDKELNDLLKGAIATILPYDSATQSGVILHSYSYSVPVIAFDVGALSRYIDDGVSGILVPYCDYNLFIEALREVKRREDVFKKNVNQVFRKYDANALRAQYSQLFDKFLK